MGSAAAMLVSPASGGQSAPDPELRTRGVVLVPEDLTLTEWPDLAHQAGLTTIALHHGVSPQAVVHAVESERGRVFLDRCRSLGLQVEYELHAMKELLPRGLFEKDRNLFRTNEQGERTPDVNLCVHSTAALEIVAQNALALAKRLRPTTGRYFFWGDDGAPWCRCPKCRELSDSDQALLLENHLCKTLRAENPRAQLAHLAYSNTLPPPQHIRPDSGVFLEYAPINRRYDIPYSQQAGKEATDGLSLLDANLKIFRADTAQVLEYWLDVSRFSRWRRPAARLPWNGEVFRADVGTYRSRGIRNITSFAAWIDADYRKRFGEPDFLQEYGEGLRSSQAVASRHTIAEWRTAMAAVHTRFTGKPGTLAQFGDSITETRAFWTPLAYERKNAPAAMDKAFQAAKAHLVPDAWAGGKGPENGNLGGQTVQWALDHVDDWLKRLNPEAAVILFGTNDLQSVDVRTYSKQLTRLVKRCLDNGTVVLLTTIPPRHGLEAKAAAFAAAAREVAKAAAVPVIDFHAEILRRRPEDWDGALDRFSAYRDYDVPTLIARDGVHPSYTSRFQSDYSDEGLRSSGYTLRNYLTLLKYAEVIDVVRSLP